MGKLRFCLAGEYAADTSRIGGGVMHVMYLLGQTFAESTDIDFHLVAFGKGFDGVRTLHASGMIFHCIEQPKNRIVPNLLTQAARVAPVIREIRPDVVNSHHCVATEAAVLAGCKVVHTLHGVTHKEIPYLRGKARLAAILQSWRERNVLPRADGVISVTQYGLDAYAPWISGKTGLIDVPIEDVFAQVPPLSTTKGIVFAGSICPRKNLGVLLRAMPAVLVKHPDAVLYVCGGVADQRYKNDLDLLVSRQGIGHAVRFLGVVDRTELAELLGRSVALVLLSYQESAPGVICQAMAAGRVPIASPVGGVPEMIEDGVTGFLVDADDSDKLAERLIELLSDFNKAKQMGAAARAVAVERYDRHKVADRILEICSSVVAAGTKVGVAKS